MATEPRRVLLVDDHPGMRALIRTLFDLDRPDDVVIEAATAEEGLAQWREQRPDIVLLDQVLGARRGLDDVAAPILEEDPTMPVVLFTAFLDHRIRDRATALGVVECVTQDELRRLPELVEKLTS